MLCLCVAMLAVLLWVQTPLFPALADDEGGNPPVIQADDPGEGEGNGSNPAGDNPGGGEDPNPGGDNPGGDNPGGDNPGGDNPGGDNPGGDNPGGDNPGGDNPGGDNPGGDNPGGDNPGGNNPGGDNPGGDNPGGDNPGGDNPGGDNPGGDNPGGDNPGGGDDPNPGGDPSATENLIDNVWIVARDTNRPVFGYADNPNLVTLSITARGGTLQLDHIIRWASDWTRNRNSAYATWSSSDPSIASIVAGDLTAHANGTVTIYATVPAVYSATGEDLVASCIVNVMGQDEAPYITSLRIIREDGSSIDGPVVITDDLSVAFEQFFCEATVMDPATGTETVYSTMNGPLSTQTNGAIGDVKWSVGDSAVGSIDEDLGWYRPSRYGSASIWVTSWAGFGGSQIRESITVSTKDPNGGLHSDGYFPQPSLTIKAFYELYLPSEYGDAAYVIDYTFSLEELESLGIFQEVYTATGSGSFWTYTGRGVLLSAVLRAAGVNIAGIYQLSFGTADNLDRAVSPNFVFATNRYYLPNIDINSYSGAVQVAPMLAFVSAENRNGSTAPDYAHMVENTRFRLLFGATLDPNAGNSSYQIKWINTIFVILKGGPAYQEGDGNGDGSGDGDGEGSGGGTIEQGGTDAASGAIGDTSSQGVSPVDEGTEPEEITSNGVYGRSGTESGGKPTIYQVMNPDDSDTDFNIEEPLFFKRFGLPIALVMMVLGGTQYGLWFRRQSRRMGVAARTGESSGAETAPAR